MAYCTLNDLRDILPKNITIGNSTTPTVTAARSDSVTINTASKYIYFASQFVDSRLSQIYLVPLTQITKVTVNIIANMLPGSTDVMVNDISGFNVGSAIRIQDDNGSELASVGAIPETIVSGGATVKNFNHLTLSSPTTNAYDAGSHGRVHILVYSDPIPVMTARLACTLIFDRLFVADQHPDVSNYGKTLRNLVTVDMNAILSGQIRLVGQEIISKRFVRGQLFDVVKLALENISIDQGKE